MHYLRTIFRKGIINVQIIKKYWYIIILLIALVISFCFYLKSKTPNQNEIANNVVNNETIEEYAKNYFDNFVSVANINEYNVTIKMLKEAVNQGLANYDESKLNECEDDSYIKFIIETGETNYKSYESNLICK